MPADRPTPLSRLAQRARRALGADDTAARLAALQAQVEGLTGRVADLAAAQSRGPVYFGDHTVLLGTRWGAKMLVHTRDAALAPWLALDGLWEAQVTSWLEATLHPGMVFVDVGANVGYFTLLGAKLVGPAGRVLAIEAHPLTAGILQRNVVMNGYYGYVTTRHGAAWSSNTELEFHLRTTFTSNSSVGTLTSAELAVLGDTEEAIQVPGVALDDLVAEVGLRRVDVVKIDVEGAERHVLEGLRRTIEGNPELTLMLEWGRAMVESVGDTPAALAATLDRFGFRMRLLETGQPVTSAELLELPYGNVVASR